MTYKLYAAEVSLYSGKARAYLRHKGVPFEEIQATRAVYKEVIIPRVGYPIIPVLVTPDDETVQDTTDIIDYVEDHHPDVGLSVYPTTPRQRLAALLLEVYGDEWLLIPAMHYRWNHNLDFTLKEFGRLSQPDAPSDQWKQIGQTVAAPFHGALPFLGITDKTTAAIEASYIELLAELQAHFARYDYVFGDAPSIGDFGLCGPLYAHLYRDPASGDLMKEKAPAVAAWCERMQEPPKTKPMQPFLPDDEVPPTLLPVLQRMAREQWPVLRSTAELLAAFAQSSPGPKVPRAIGTHAFSLGDVTEDRAVFPFSLYMFQRPLDYLDSLSGKERKAADRLLEQVGLPLGEMPAFPRLTRERFKLRFEGRG